MFLWFCVSLSFTRLIKHEVTFRAEQLTKEQSFQPHLSCKASHSHSKEFHSCRSPSSMTPTLRTALLWLGRLKRAFSGPTVYAAGASSLLPFIADEWSATARRAVWLLLSCPSVPSISTCFISFGTALMLGETQDDRKTQSRCGDQEHQNTQKCGVQPLFTSHISCLTG